MRLEHLLLVDDSQAILAYERAALSPYYSISTASNGQEALEKAGRIRPALIVLDLSMPIMNGEEFLVQLRADTELREVPVVIVSSEDKRAQACFERGDVAAFLRKPVRSPQLLGTVERVLRQVSLRKGEGDLTVLPVQVGSLDLGIPLDSVRMVILQPATQRVPGGPFYLSEMIQLHEETVLVLDLALRFGVEHSQPLAERKLVVVSHGDKWLALSVDQVKDPEKFAASRVQRRDELGGAQHRPLDRILLAIVQSDDGPLPVVAPETFLSQKLIGKVYRAVMDARADRADPPAEAPA